MNANIEGCLKNLRKCYKDLEHNDKPLTYQECKKILLWAKAKGYKTVYEIQDAEIDVLLVEFIKPVKELYYYDIPTLYLCKDLKGNSYLIVILDDNGQYIGKRIPPQILDDFLSGKICLLTAFQQSSFGYFVTQHDHKKDAFLITPFEPKEEHLPEIGLFYQSK